MRIFKKIAATILALCILCGLPFSVNAANTITLERASVIATAADSVTVQAIFSAPIYLQKGRMDLGRQVFTLRNSHAGGGCASSYANQWTWETKSNLVDYVNPIMKGTTPYSSVINLTFPRCSCADHATLWGADGNTLPGAMELCISDLWGTAGDGVIDSNNAIGYNGELLATTGGTDVAYVSVTKKVITLESAKLLSTAADSVTVEAVFSDLIHLQEGRLDLGRMVFSLRNSHAGGGCTSSYANQWTWETNSSLVSYVNPKMKGTTPYSSVIHMTFPRCSCSDHAELWGEDGTVLPDPIELCIYDQWGTSGDGVIDSNNVIGYNDELLATTNGTDFAYVSVEEKSATLESATFLSATEDTVTVQANFSAPIHLEDDLTDPFIYLKSEKSNTACSATAFCLTADSTLIEYMEPTTVDTTLYSSVIRLTFNKCDCAEHAGLWGEDGKTLPANAVLCIEDLSAVSGDGFISVNQVVGLNGERLATTEDTDMAYVTVYNERIFLESATFLSATADTVTVRAVFSAPICLQKGRMDLGRKVFTIRNSHSGGGCESSYANQWTWETKSSLVKYVDPLTKGENQYASVIDLTFPRCSCSDHATLWGAQGNTLPNPIEFCINDLWGASGDGVIDSNNAIGYNGELLATTGDGDTTYVPVKLNDVTLDTALLLEATDTTVTVQASFSGKVTIQDASRIMLAPAYTAGKCASSNAADWQMYVKSVEYVDAVVVDGKSYASTLKITFNKCTCSDHAALWGADGKTLPEPIVLVFSDAPNASWAKPLEDEYVSRDFIVGLFGERLVATERTEDKSYDVAYTAVTAIPKLVQMQVVDTVTMSVTFNQEVAAATGMSVVVQLLEGDTVVDEMPVKLTVDGVNGTIVPANEGEYRNFIALWQAVEAGGYSLRLALFTDANKTGTPDSYLDFGHDDYAFEPSSFEVRSVEVIDQTRVVVTFSEAVEIDQVTAAIRLVNDRYETKMQSGKAMYWPGYVQYYDDTQTTIVFVLYDTAQQVRKNAAVPLDGLDEIYNAGYEVGGWKLVFALGDTDGNAVVDGMIGSVVGTTGKILLADVMADGLDLTCRELDAKTIAQGELTMTGVKVLSDIEAIVTFSAPVQIENQPYFGIRLLNEAGRLIYRTEDGTYVLTSKTDGVPNTPMQWGCTWTYHNEEHTQIKLWLQAGLDGHTTFSGVFSINWSEEVPGSVISMGVEENRAPAISDNGRIDNIRLASDSRVRLTATKLDSSYDAVYLAPVMEYEPKSIAVSARIINELQVRISFSSRVEISGTPNLSLRYINPETGLQGIWGSEEFVRVYLEWSGTWKWENDSHTSIIWTMSGQNSFAGASNIHDLVNYVGALEIFKGYQLVMSIQEATTSEFSIIGNNFCVDNISLTDGKNHLEGTVRDRGLDVVYMPLNTSSLAGKAVVELISVQAVDDQTIELTFSEPVTFLEGEQAPTIVLRYVNAKGQSEGLADGKTANFKGDLSVSEDRPCVVIWKLNTKHAKNLTDIFNYNGNLKWNTGARVVMVMENTAEDIPSYSMRLWGITDSSGMRMLAAPYQEAAVIMSDVEIVYDLPARQPQNADQQEPIIQYYTNYIPYIVVVACAVVAGVIVFIVTVTGRKKEEK